MAAITFTSSQIAPVHPQNAEIYDMVAGADIEAGEPLYIDASAGTVKLADGDGSGTLQFCGIALNDAGTGGAVSVLMRGAVYGFDLSGENYWGYVYVSDTAGGYADTAGSTEIRVGRVIPLSDSSLTKVLYVQADFLNTWS